MSCLQNVYTWTFNEKKNQFSSWTLKKVALIYVNTQSYWVQQNFVKYTSHVLYFSIIIVS